MTFNIHETTKALQGRPGYVRVFALLWLITFIIYLPAAKAGLVGDMPYLFDAARKGSFIDFVSIKEGTALYQIAAFNFYVLIKLFGTHVWLWHLLYVTMHAINGLLLFVFFSGLLVDSRIRNGVLLSLIAVVLFAICPHASEVVVWDASNHHSVATALIFLNLILLRKFLLQQRAVYAIISSLLFAYATFSHEFFYLTPVFTLLLIAYYRYVLNLDKAVFKKALIWFFVPLLALFLMHLGLLRIVKHTYISHFGKLEQMNLAFYLSKPVKYLFHVLMLGRFFPFELRNNIYALCNNLPALIAFYGLCIVFWAYVVYAFKRVSNKLKLVAFISGYLMVIYLFLSPVFFADSLLVCYDRYVYPSLGFAYLLLVLLISFIPQRSITVSLLLVYAAINLWFTTTVNIYWKQSAYVIKRLINDMPDPGNKTVLILNLPDNLNGIPMIAAQDDGRFKIMKNNFTDHPVNNKVYDVVAYNMTTMNDGAHVTVVNDSMLHVTLNQWGTWWLYGLLGAGSYQTADYKVNMIDEGHWYELTLKKPANVYMVLFQSGTQWKVVDWSRPNVDQY